MLVVLKPESQVMNIAEQLIDSKATIFRAGVWKPRTRPGSFEGVGEKALPWLQRVKKETGLITAIEIANTDHIKLALDYDVDILWIGARTTVNPFAVQDIADELQNTDKIIWVKNPVNPDLELWIGAVERLIQAGIKNIGAIHRGFSSYNSSHYRNPPKWQIPIDFRRKMPDIPMICDPSHICGNRDTLENVAQTALDLQYDGIMLEVHNTPDDAWSDAKQQITPSVFKELIYRLVVRQKSIEGEEFLSKLSLLRAEIDTLDMKIIDILYDRMQIVKDIGKVKKEQNVAVFQKERFNDILLKLIEYGNKMGLSRELINTIMKAIHIESIATQEKIINEK
ncbi:MAG: bifunctional 3-deoxy-7-phosphoheptulonate synthase/chorismate mutase type II [Saprospiraceae bacterium]